MTRPPRGRRLPRPLAVLTGIAVVAGLALTGVGAWELFSPGGEPARAATERRDVARSDSPPPMPPAAAPHSVAIPAIGFRTDVGALATGSAPALNPPEAGRAYWLSDYGLPGEGANNTVYLVGHTSADGRAVFDPLVDRAEQQSTVLPGDEVTLDTDTGTVTYEVIAVERHNRQRLSELESVWTNAPGRLVLITCFFERSTDEISDNLVVFARALG